MSKSCHVHAGITVSVDGYVTGPDDGPGQGLGVGGERLHYWVFGGAWTYDSPRGEMAAADQKFYDAWVATLGAGVCGRTMYDAAGAWGGTNPFPGTLVVLTHRTEDAPDSATGFVFVDGLEAAIDRARADAGDGDVALSGGADLIRQALHAGVVDELAITTAPVVLGRGKRLFDGFTDDVDLEIVAVYPSEHATHVRYAVRR